MDEATMGETRSKEARILSFKFGPAWARGVRRLPGFIVVPVDGSNWD
jgi:hypothetical protein